MVGLHTIQRLDNIVLLTMRKRNELRVDMEDWTGGKAYAHYASISVDPEQLGYTLHLGAFTTGDAGDALKNHNGMKFTTFDKDQDTWDKNCASSVMGGFWYLNCHDANPNGLYIPDSASPHGPVYVSWDTWKGNTYSLKTITMKMRSLSQCSN
ncbi:microfibril-associated glycoprotein 4-like [Alosa sapidissima]|uniref:microfibril-associated glycoprotein 4-like n=1 Tax=Alosa sapidissima TaxID=34773 RepID=UPI001C099AC5|nr:microfibril-associated glycoprotein 4-like [Alosa sapidissima]